MAPERLQKVERILHAALEVDEKHRTDFLNEVCGADGDLRRELESLLAWRSRAEEFIERPAMEVAARQMTPEDVRGQPRGAPWMPIAIGSYRIVRILGEGGMGCVYEAEQEQLRRTVALKVIKPGLATPELLRRFEQESQALARLQHPGIAQIYEVGTADTGFGQQPYFAMELICGDSLREYAERHRLDTRQRLELMVRICEAVQHAHQRGLIHRDLKPGNILVEETGQPRILDFGVARVTDSDVETTRRTDLGQLVGTLAYMSPEQVLADPLELDTRSDVYALGVILYELLAGRLPYDFKTRPHEAARIIRDEEPPALGSLNRVYRGDIETIVAKALEKDKTRRYASALGLAADIQRFLSNEPISARPPSASYQLRKFARRHRALVAGVVAVFVVLLVGIVASTWEATRARRAEQIAAAVNNFLQNDLLAQAAASTQARPGAKPDPDLKVRTALDRAAAGIEGRFGNQPEVEAAIRETIGNTYEDLGIFPDAEHQMERALDLRRRILGPEHSETLETMGSLAIIYWDEGKYPKAEPMFKALVQIRRRLKGQDARETLTSMHNLASVYQNEGRYAETESLLAQVLEVRRRTQGEENPDTLAAMHNLASLYLEQGRYKQAELAFANVLNLRRRVLGEEHPSTLRTIGFVAKVYRYEGKTADAEALYTKVVNIFKRVFGEENIDTLGIMIGLSGVYRDQGRNDEAERLLARVLEESRRVLGTEHPVTVSAMGNLAAIYRDEDRTAEAEPLLKKVLALRRQLLGAEHPYTQTAMYDLGLYYAGQRKYAEADSLLTQVLETRRRILGGEHPDTLAAIRSLADVYLSERKPGEAEPLLRGALAVYEKASGDNWARYSCESMLGASLAGQRKYSEGEPLLISGYQGVLQRQATLAAYDRLELERAGQRIIQLYRDWQRPEHIADWSEKLQATKLSAVPARN